jgi:uracil-DNA glycosylase
VYLRSFKFKLNLKEKFTMDVKIAASWKLMLTNEFEKPYFQKLVAFVKDEYKNHTVYPPARQIFNAFDHCSFEDARVIIIGQDPYHGPNQGNGLCFSVNDGIRKPPSLLNIFKELKSDLGKEIPESGNLERWADQGVLLLNATLTVRANSPGSHQKMGWEEFTDAVIQLVSAKKQNTVFILWGVYAQSKGEIIDLNKHLVIKSAHPSPFAAHRGFFGSQPFSKTNAYLNAKGLKEIDW